MLLLSELNMLIIVELFMTLVNLTQFIFYKIMCLMIVNIYKMHIGYNYLFGILLETKKLETKNILIKEKNYKNLVIYFTRYDQVYGRSSIIQD